MAGRRRIETAFCGNWVYGRGKHYTYDFARKKREQDPITQEVRNEAPNIPLVFMYITEKTPLLEVATNSFHHTLPLPL
jgi:hypothetical protein